VVNKATIYERVVFQLINDPPIHESEASHGPSNI